MIRIATCQYQLETLDWDAYTRKVESLVLNAKRRGAKLLLLPEYAGTEIGGNHNKDSTLFAEIQTLLPQYINFYQQLSCQHHIYIQPGTIPVIVAEEKYVNRAYFFGPNGVWSYQDKLQLTEYEKSSKIIDYGENQVLFESDFGKIGIAICYDCEFPEVVRRLVEAGAWLILVPSYTNSSAGYHRVILSCRARAIENQCYVAVSFVVGPVGLGSDVPEETVGRAAIFGPADNGFPDDGIIKQGSLNKISMIFGDVGIEKLSMPRQHGQVHNFYDAKRCDIIKQNKIKISIL